MAAIGMLADRPVGERRLLLVEDNPADADLVAEYLLDVGEETPHLERAASLGEALELLGAERPFTAILLDLNLPDSTGLETLDRVLERGPSAPVIVMTGGDAGDLGVLAVARGAADFLPKDELTGRLLLRSVRYATERAHRRDVQAQYRALVENSRDLVSILERDLTIRYVSPSIRRVLGYRPEEREGTDVSVDVHPEDLDRVRAEVERLLADPGHTSHLQYRVKHKDGSWRSLDTIAQNCFDDPHIGGFVVSARDVTDLFAAQEEARATARRLERTVGALQDAVLTLELPSRSITDCNAATEAMFGYSAGEMLGRSTKLLHVDEESFLQLEAESLAALRDEGSFHAEARMRRKDRTVFPAEITISYVHSARGRGESVVKVVRDITERVDRLQRLRFQAALLQEVGQPVLAVDEEARLTYWNRAAEELTGFTSEEVRGTSIVDLLVIEEDPDAAIAAREMARGGGRWEGEIRIRMKDGGVATVQATATPGVNPDGSPGGRIAAGVDITELRRAEEESRRAAERLRLQAELLEAVGQAVIATDLDGRIIYWNRAAEELYGWARGQIGAGDHAQQSDARTGRRGLRDASGGRDLDRHLRGAAPRRVDVSGARQRRTDVRRRG